MATTTPLLPSRSASFYLKSLSLIPPTKQTSFSQADPDSSEIPTNESSISPKSKSPLSANQPITPTPTPPCSPPPIPQTTEVLSSQRTWNANRSPPKPHPEPPSFSPSPFTSPFSTKKPKPPPFDLSSTAPPAQRDGGSGRADSPSWPRTSKNDLPKLSPRSFLAKVLNVKSTCAAEGAWAHGSSSHAGSDRTTINSGSPQSHKSSNTSIPSPESGSGSSPTFYSDSLLPSYDFTALEAVTTWLLHTVFGFNPAPNPRLVTKLQEWASNNTSATNARGEEYLWMLKLMQQQRKRDALLGFIAGCLVCLVVGVVGEVLFGALAGDWEEGVWETVVRSL